MCYKGGGGVKNGPNLCYVFFERSLINLTPVEIPKVADSGCQSSIIRLSVARCVYFSDNDIIPVTLGMAGLISEDLGGDRQHSC